MVVPNALNNIPSYYIPKYSNKDLLYELLDEFNLVKEKEKRYSVFKNAPKNHLGLWLNGSITLSYDKYGKVEITNLICILDYITLDISSSEKIDMVILWLNTKLYGEEDLDGIPEYQSNVGQIVYDKIYDMVEDKTGHSLSNWIDSLKPEELEMVRNLLK